MAYKKGQPKKEAVINLGTGNHIVVRWLNTYFEFPPEGHLIVSNEDAHIIFEGGELELVEALSKGHLAQTSKEEKK